MWLFVSAEEKISNFLFGRNFTGCERPAVPHWHETFYCAAPPGDGL